MNVNKERQLIENILCKFIINLPPQEVNDTGRLSYHTEKAFYYLIDIINKDTNLHQLAARREQLIYKFRQFCPPCIKIKPKQLISKSNEHKPVCGAIVINKQQTKMLVTRVGSKFGFPKGKWNENQTPERCAAREVQQETGIYIHNKIDRNIKIQFQYRGAYSYFFVARDVSSDDKIRMDPKEIDDVFWMQISQICIHIQKFNRKSQMAWQIFQKQENNKQLSMESFLNKYSDNTSKTKQQFRKPLNILCQNPLINFAFNRQQLKRCLFDGIINDKLIQ